MDKRKRKKQPNEDPSNYRLKVPRAQAAAELEQRIAEGKALCQQVDPRSDREMHEFEQAYFRWHDKNRDVLYGLYTTTYVRDVLYDPPGPVLAWTKTPQEIYKFTKENIKSRVDKLSKLLSGLPLLEAPSDL